VIRAPIPRGLCVERTAWVLGPEHPVLRTSSCDVGGRERPLQADTGWWWSLIHFGTVLQRGQPRTAAASLLADFTITPKGVLLQRGRPGAAAARQIEIAGSIGHTVQSEAGSLRIA
jgi:hypothetical protein